MNILVYSFVKGARNPPFTVLKWGDFDILDYETRIKKECQIPKGLLISKSVRIDYFPNGKVHVFNVYKGKLKRFLIEKSITAEDAKKYYENCLKAICTQENKNEVPGC